MPLLCFLLKVLSTEPEDKRTMSWNVFTYCAESGKSLISDEGMYRIEATNYNVDAQVKL